MQEIDYGAKNEINTLVLEHDILTKTIFRLYQQDSHLTKIQRDKLLTRYQYQLGIITAKIKKLEEIITNKDANTLEERLVSVIEQKFSNMDKKIQAALDSKNSSQIQHPKQKSIKSRKEEYSGQKDGKNAYSLGLELNSYKYKPLEITTLTEVPSKLPEFFQSNFKPPKLKVENIQSTVDVAKVVENVIQSNVCINPGCTNPKFTNKYCSVHTDSYEKETNENKASLPSLELEQHETIQHVLKENPVELSAQESSSELAQDKKDSKLSQDDDLEENDDDVMYIKAQIEKSLANLDQAEVE
uniref:Uncharacterized protein n=3 Tax=environmental samples TaxID=651140 RepID=A0A075GZ72_9ARCH|nr:hypothetical protein [uncultured marine thaumarchaeote KM3_204_F10]AIF10761.1 hypothetical protein [uncultured marine thaumarchaeote KM3_47_A03]AIF10809.1 hypothetical protein [uncultured marine thaumarchaeote KM3_47_A04]